MNPKRILVTGASGFLGTRLVERLLFIEKVDFRAMAHNVGRAARLARLPVEIAWCNLLDPKDVDNAVTGCDVIVHCAYGAVGPIAAEKRAVTVDGTRNLLEAAVRHKVKRFVHISTIAVHSYSPPEDIDETYPLVKGSDGYCRDKVDSERIVWKYYKNKSVPIVVLRMGNIFGPFSGPWTLRPLNHIRDGVVSLVEEGSAPSNMVYVDNAVEAILKSIANDSAVGEAFFITDDQVSWATFYGKYADWLGTGSLQSVNRGELEKLLNPTFRELTRALWSEVWGEVVVPITRYSAFRVAGSKLFARMASAIWRPIPLEWRKRILGDPTGKSVPAPVTMEQPASMLPSLGLLEVYAGKAALRNDKAKRILGFGPEKGLEESMEYTRKWAAWARLI